jgi:hypothetical protein
MATDDHEHMIEAIAYTVARDIANLEDANEKIDTLAGLIATNAKSIERLMLRVEILSNQMRAMNPVREVLVEEVTQKPPLMMELSISPLSSAESSPRSPPKPAATSSRTPRTPRALFLLWILSASFLLWYGATLYRSSGLRASLFATTCPIPSYGPVPYPVCLA